MRACWFPKQSAGFEQFLMETRPTTAFHDYQSPLRVVANPLSSRKATLTCENFENLIAKRIGESGIRYVGPTSTPN